MNRWKKAALISVLAAASMFSGSSAQASVQAGYQAETAAINVANHFPGNMATGVALDTPLTVEFAGPVTQAFYQTINFSLFNGTQPVDGELFYNPAARQVMFKSKQPLTSGAAYTAQISYFDGLGRNADRVWSFRTAENAAMNNSGNQRTNSNVMILTGASMGTGSVQPGTPLDVSFSEPLAMESLKKAPIKMFANNRQLPVDYKLSRDLKTVTVAPRDPLKPGVDYTIAVEKNIASSKGSSIANRTLIPFKLAGVSDPRVPEYEINETTAPAGYASQQAPVQSDGRYAAAFAENYGNYAAPQSYQGMQQPQFGGQQPQFGGQQPQFGGQQPQFGGQQPQFGGQQPQFGGQQPQFGGQQPQFGGQQPQFGSMQAQMPQPPKAPSAPKKEAVKDPDTTELVAHYQQPVDDAQVVGLAPRNGSVVTNLTQPVTIGFNCDINADTLNEFTFRLEDDFGPVPAKIHYFENNRQATLTPVGLLESGKNYRVVVTQGVTDTFGRPIKTGVSSMFAMSSPSASPAMPNGGSAQYARNDGLGAFDASIQQNQNPRMDTAELESLDNIKAPMGVSSLAARPAMAPANRTVSPSYGQANQGLVPFKVISVYPASDANNISRSSKIALNFSEQADPKTINNINISVFGNQKRVDGKVIYDRRKNRAIFEPDRKLDADTEYKVIVSNKIHSKMGEPLAQRVSWQFSTAENERRRYVPQSMMEADAAFYLPLADSKYKPSAAQIASMQTQSSQSSFNYVAPKHWSFKAVKHIAGKGLLPAYPFSSNNNITRYEFASAVNSALNNLKGMQSTQSSKLKVADMVQLQQLIVEYRPELRSYGVNTSWFEGFLSQQGVDLRQVENSVRNQGI